MTSSTKWTALAVVALVGVAALGLGVWWIRSPRVADQQPFPTPAPPADVGEPGLPPAEGKAAERVEVKGRVLGPDGQPVAGAKLFLRTDQVFAPAPQAVANGDGRFTFTVDADERHCTVLATAPGRGVSWRSLYPRPLPEFVFRLTPDEPIRGTVVGPTGKPVAGVSVSVESISQPARNPSLDEWLKAARDPNGGRSDSDLDWLRGSYDGFAELLPPVTTDRDGRFEIRGVGRDRIADLLVSGPAVAPDQVSVVTRKVERFTTRWKGVLETHEETYHGADLVVSTTPVPVTTGRVLDEATGQPVPGTLLRVHSRTVGTGTRPWMEVEVAADAEGRFTLPGLKLGDEGGRVQVVPPDGSPYHRLDVKVKGRRADVKTRPGYFVPGP